MREMTPAEDAVRETIARQGPITFRRFMEMALYAAPGAYYASGTSQIGPRGDYYTSPELHPSFGALVARQMEQVWAAMGHPEGFTVVEAGAGSGALARDILSYAALHSPEFLRALQYVIVEPRAAFASRQQQTIRTVGSPADRVLWIVGRHEGTYAHGTVEGCFVSNELPDAFPVHRVSIVGGAVREVYVDVAGGRLVEVLGRPSTPELEAYFQRLGLLPPEGARVEVNLDALAWMRRVAGSLGRGAVIAIDYGYSASELYSERHMDGTLLCFYRHTIVDDPYARIGLQDMTTHVDFTSLAAEGESVGLHAVGLTTQQAFLSALGMNAFISRLRGAGLHASEEEANRLAMHNLLDPSGLGRVKVLIQQKALPGFDPAGLRRDGVHPSDLGRDTSVEPSPLLRPGQMRLNSSPNMDLFVDTHGMWNDLMADDEEDE